MRQLLQLLGYVRPHAPKLVAAIALMAIVGMCHGLTAVLIEPVFDRVLEPDTTPEPIRLFELPFTEEAIYLDDWLPDALGSDWGMIAAAILGVFLIKGLCDFLGNFLVNYAGLAGVRDLRNHVYRVVLNQSPAFFQRTHTGKLISSLVNDVERIQVALSHILADLLRQGFIVTALLWVLMQTDWKLATVSLTVLPAVLIPTSRIGKRIRRTTRTAQDQLGDLTQILEETIAGNRVVKAFGMEAFEEHRFRAAADRLFRSGLRYVKQQAISSPLIEVFGALTIVALLSYVRGQVMVGEMTAGQFTTFVVALLMLYQPVKRLNGIYNIFQQALGSSERVFEYLSHPHDVADAPSGRKLEPFSHSIVLEGVGFSYPQTEASADNSEQSNEATLSDVDLTVKAGEVVAIVGPSGAGKSTLMNLLPRFFDPTEGRILIDGTDLREATLASLREQIALVTQETFLFADTVANNIAYGRPDVPRSTLEEAARSAIADQFISELPQGYETDLGERGLRLSGGQRQRLAIARALLKNAPILLLDEATSHLDAESEQLVQQALANLMEGRTVIVVAHRLSTIRNADKIVVLEAGRVTAVGSHERLLAVSETYRRLVELQSVG